MNFEKIKKDMGIKKGEIPVTNFKDNMSSIKVELLDWPDEARLKKVLVNFATGSWYADAHSTIGDSQEEIDALENGSMLPQGLEHPQFAFRVENLSLHGTHALVRSRIGIAYLQQSHAVKDQRHDDVLVPRAFTKHNDLLLKYMMWVQIGKQLYADMLDTGDIAITDARFCLPKTMPSWINVTVSLATLLNIYAKRSDTQEEHPEMNIMAEQMKQLVVEKFPWMSSYFKSNCDTGKCMHNRPGYKSNCIFKRDEKHQLSEGVIEDGWTLHDKTKQELMLDADEFEGVLIEGKLIKKFYQVNCSVNSIVSE